MDKIRNYLKWDYFEKVVKEKGFSYFSLYDLERIFPSHRLALKKFLNRKLKEEKIVRLKRNLYCLADKKPSDYLIANILYQPSYLSLEWALSFYSIIPEVIYPITSVTTKPTREFNVLNRVFSYQTIKKEAFCGYFINQSEDGSFLIATPEKALADYLYFVYLRKKVLNERIDWKKVDKNKVKHYLLKNFNLSLLSVNRLIQ